MLNLSPIFLEYSLMMRIGAIGSPSLVAMDVVPFRAGSSPSRPTLSTANFVRVFFTTLYCTAFCASSRRSCVSSATVMPL